MSSGWFGHVRWMIQYLLLTGSWIMKDGIHSRYRTLTCGPLVVSCLQVARKDNSLIVHEGWWFSSVTQVIHQ